MVAQDEVDVLGGAGAYTLFPTMALLAGMLGGMLGIGGGMIINPMLIEVGMHPQVHSVTPIFVFMNCVGFFNFSFFGGLIVLLSFKFQEIISENRTCA